MPTLSEIAALVGCPIPASAELAQRQITGVNSLDEAGPSELSFVSSDAYLKALSTTRAAAVLMQKRIKAPADLAVALLVVDDADLAIARVLQLFAPPVPHPPAGVDSAARVAATAQLGSGVAIGPFVVVGQRCRIGQRTILHGGVALGDDVSIGDDCVLYPNVVVRERVSIGHRVMIHASSTLGTDGFGYRWDGSRHVKVPQIGTVIIEDDVEIGSSVCIDRAKFGATFIGRGTKIDNLVQIGHNVRIGPHCIIVGQTGLAGSARLGVGVVLGGQTAVRDHILIGDGAMAAATSGIIEDVPPKSIVSGRPAMPHRQSLREQAAMRRLPDLVVQIRKLQEEIEKLKAGH